MAKKLKKANERRGLSPKAKFTLVSVFKGLINNQAVIDGSKESAWWVAAIFLVFSIFLPLVPNFVSLSNANGANFISTYNFGLDQEMTRFAYTMDSNNVELMVEGGKLHYYENGTVRDDAPIAIGDTLLVGTLTNKNMIIDVPVNLKGMDANNFNYIGIATIGVACGYSKNHTLQEQMVLEDFFKAGDLAEQLILTWAEDCK